MDKKLSNVKRKNKGNKQYNIIKRDQKRLSNNIQNMINKSKNNKNKDSPIIKKGLTMLLISVIILAIKFVIYYVDQQTEELEHEMDEQQRNILI